MHPSSHPRPPRGSLAICFCVAVIGLAACAPSSSASSGSSPRPASPAPHTPIGNLPAGWRQLQAGSNPTATSGVLLGYDAGRDQLIMLANNRVLGPENKPPTVWRWDGSRWLLLDGAMPDGAFYGAAMAYEEGLKLLMVG